MSKKQLNTTAIRNELEGSSLFFTTPSSPPPVSPPPVEAISESRPEENSLPPVQPHVEHKDTKASETTIKPAHSKASTDASKLAKEQAETIEAVRKVVKLVGKEPLFLRLTPEEKREVSSIAYTFNELYSSGGRKTTENDIGRIAVNYLICEYRENGEQSILAKVLAALNA